MNNESNNPVRSYDGREDYSECICFNFDPKTNEFENHTDLYVSAEKIQFSDENLTVEQSDEVQTFAEEIQTQIKNQIWYCRMIEQTESSLMYN